MYSRCKGCGVDLIKVGEGWKTAPRGYRVIWKDPNAPETETARAPAKRKPRSASKGRGTAKKVRPRKTEAKADAAKAADSAKTAAKDGKDAAPTKRRRTERRVAKEKPLPAKLAGKDRRRSRNRRQGFGKKPDVEA